MAGRYDRLPAIQVVGEVTAQSLLEALNPILAEINSVLSELSTAEAETRGDDGRTPQFRANIDMDGNRITNASRSRDPEDGVIRQELMDLGLLGDPTGISLNNVTLGPNVSVPGVGGGSNEIANASGVAEAIAALEGTIPVAVEGQEIDGRDFGRVGTTQGTILMARGNDGRVQILQSDNGRLLFDNELIADLLLRILMELRRINGVDD